VSARSPLTHQEPPLDSNSTKLSAYSTLIAVILGALIGLFAPALSAWIPPQIGWLFIRLLKLLAPPLVLFACLRSILTLGDVTQLKRVGGRAALYYLSTSALAALAGVLCSLIFLGDAAYKPATDLSVAPAFEGGRFLEKLIPSDLISPLLNAEILQLITIGVASALLILRRPDAERAQLSGLITALDELINEAVKVTLKLTPVASLCIIAQLTATLDWASLAPFKSFLWAWGGATLIHSVVTLPLLFWSFTRRSPLSFVVAVKDALLVALTTASSAGTLPVSKRVLEENAGVSAESASFILPLGATLNMDGSALYQAQLLLFMCVAEGKSLSVSLIASVVGLVLFSSAGTSAIPRGGIAMMGMMIAFLGLPPLYLGLYIAIDQVLDYPITAVNVWGDLIGAKVIDERLSSPGSQQAQSDPRS